MSYHLSYWFQLAHFSVILTEYVIDSEGSSKLLVSFFSSILGACVTSWRHKQSLEVLSPDAEVISVMLWWSWNPLRWQNLQIIISTLGHKGPLNVTVDALWPYLDRAIRCEDPPPHLQEPAGFPKNHVF